MLAIDKFDAWWSRKRLKPPLELLEPRWGDASNSLWRGQRPTAAAAINDLAQRGAEELVYAILAWEASTSLARHALGKLRKQMTGINELRAADEADVAHLLGESYPHARERAARLHAALGDLFQRHQACVLHPASLVEPVECLRYLSSIEGVPPFAVARVALRMGSGCAAVPMDQRLTAVLVQRRLARPHATADGLASALAAHLPVADLPPLAAALQELSDDHGDGLHTTPLPSFATGTIVVPAEPAPARARARGSATKREKPPPATAGSDGATKPSRPRKSGPRS